MVEPSPVRFPRIWNFNPLPSGHDFPAIAEDPSSTIWFGPYCRKVRLVNSPVPLDSCGTLLRRLSESSALSQAMLGHCQLFLSQLMEVKKNLSLLIDLSLKKKASLVWLPRARRHIVSPHRAVTVYMAITRLYAQAVNCHAARLSQFVEAW